MKNDNALKPVDHPCARADVKYFTVDFGFFGERESAGQVRIALSVRGLGRHAANIAKATFMILTAKKLRHRRNAENTIHQLGIEPNRAG